MPETQDKAAVYDLVFGVHVSGDNMFSAKVVKLKDGRIAEWKHGTDTSLGHAIAMSENLLAGYALCAHEVSAQKFYSEVVLV